MSRLIIIGAGGHGKVILDVAQSAGSWQNYAFTDDRHAELKTVLGIPVIGAVSETGALLESGDDWIVAIGNPELRLRFMQDLMGKNLKLPSVIIHPRATISRHTSIAYGTVVMAGAVINPATTLGHGCIVNTSSSIDHDCRIGNGVHICPGAHLGGEVEIGENTWIGIGASIKHGVKIGKQVTVGAGTTVIRDIPDGLTVIGTPARILDK